MSSIFHYFTIKNCIYVGSNRAEFYTVNASKSVAKEWGGS